MASLTVQDVEVRSPKMICRDPFIQKVSFVRCQTSVDVLALTCYLTVLLNFISHELFVFPYWLNEIWSSFLFLGF